MSHEAASKSILVDSNDLVEKLDQSIDVLKKIQSKSGKGDIPQTTEAADRMLQAADRLHAPIREHMRLVHELEVEPLEGAASSAKTANVILQHLDETNSKFGELLEKQREEGVAPDLAPYHQVVDGQLKIAAACAFVTGEVESIFAEVNEVHRKLWAQQVLEVDEEVTTILTSANKVYLHLKEHLETVHAGAEACTEEDCKPDASNSSVDPFDALNDAQQVLERLRELVSRHMEAHCDS